jgi:hypothetical protein
MKLIRSEQQHRQLSRTACLIKEGQLFNRLLTIMYKRYCVCLFMYGGKEIEDEEHKLKAGII